ncbi:uncharacterized protein LOC115879703 [Sitophilus oryzae]|uniref:Uncharacterized protein LOC115879703 n=1 Tax=Sitophilus oryzae TaxID=7048 RepID=A0A6J2XPD8_SITOR|nr:uncharacterized protein LOC115879703 [Sitophilus oryzae]
MLCQIIRSVVFSTLFISVVSPHSNQKLNRQKRTLVFGDLTVLQLILGYAIPVPDLLVPSTSLGFFVRGVYGVPYNASDFTNPEIQEVTRNLPSLTRWDLYKVFEKDSEVKGHGGRVCILRAICEAAEAPIDKYHGFFEEVLHFIFTPTSTNEELSHHTDNEYYAAHHLGKNNKGKCKQLFPNCKLTLLDLFTQFYDNINK